MKMNNTISMALMALLTLGAGTTMAASSDTNEMMKTDGMEKMDEMKTNGMSKMDGEMKKDHKKEAAMGS